MPSELATTVVLSTLVDAVIVDAVAAADAVAVDDKAAVDGTRFCAPVTAKDASRRGTLAGGKVDASGTCAVVDGTGAARLTPAALVAALSTATAAVCVEACDGHVALGVAPVACDATAVLFVGGAPAPFTCSNISDEKSVRETIHCIW